MPGLKPAPSQWVVLATAQDVAQAALAEILDAARRAIEAHGRFRLVLAGGITPAQVYRLLAKQDCNWPLWYFYLGDERCLPVDHPDRNSHMIEHTLLDRISVPEKNVHMICAELGAKQAALDYSHTIETALPFDLVLLGMGEDGHTASLFPGQTHPENERAHAIYNAPKPPPERVSLSMKALSDNQQLLILVCGEGKKLALTQWEQGLTLPITKITSRGRIRILLDETASPS